MQLGSRRQSDQFIVETDAKYSRKIGEFGNRSSARNRLNVKEFVENIEAVSWKIAPALRALHRLPEPLPHPKLRFIMAVLGKVFLFRQR
jgi:hypothetical protein